MSKALIKSEKKALIKSPEELEQVLQDAWLNIKIDEEKLFNPLKFMPPEFETEPHLYITWLMTRPEYFSFICSEIFNVQLLPLQAAMLKEIWERKFPMVIASRGFGKMLHSNELLRIQGGWIKIKDINIGDQIYGSNGKLATVTNKTNKQMNLNMYRITLRDGRTIDCCEDHMWKIWDKNKNRKKNSIVWSNIKTKDLILKYYWDRIGGDKEYRYALPINKPLMDEKECDLLIHPYIVGVLLGDGGITESDIITNIDYDIIDRVKSLLPEGYTIKQYDYKTFRINRINNTVEPFSKLLQKIGIHGCNSHTKFIPEIYQYSSYDQRLELIRGLMDTDGYSNKSVIEYYTVSSRLSSDFLNVARSLGLHCKHTMKESWLNGRRYTDCNRISIYTKTPIFTLSRKLTYIDYNISKQGQSKYDKVFITNIEYIGKDDGYCISVDSSDHTYITKDYIVTHNSFLMGLYALMRLTLMPGRKLVICGAAFRQSKIIFDYMESIWMSAPLLRDMVGTQGSGPKRDTDMCRFHLSGGLAVALPIGDGSRIRGQRANDIIMDEFASVSREIFENVIAGFAAVKSAPVDNVRSRAYRDMAKKLKIELPEKSKAYDASNQIIITGTAYYDFNHFADYWKRWREIIKSKGNIDRLRNIFGDDDIPEDFDWRDYSIIRIPYELVPRGFMDESMIARSKATIHSGIYAMEFGACHCPNTLIQTSIGIKKIIDVRIGDKVLTHKGRFRNVTKITYRPYNGKIIKYKTVGYNKCVLTTPEHPFWTTDDNFDLLYNINNTNIVNLNELYGLYSIDILDFTTNVLETYDTKHIYPRGSKSNIDLDQQRHIRRNLFNHTQTKLSKIYNTCQSSISYIQTNKNIPKNSVYRNINLDYDFGLIIGYYAAEGNISTNGNAVEFSLDEHKDTEYQKQLLAAIKNVFGFCGKSYIKKKNCVVININSRIVADVIKKICPGKSATKIIDHNILFSNEEFLHGVIEGYWNGDGHIRKERAVAHCINQSLLNQIRLGLSYFNISSSLVDGSQGNDYSLNMSGNNFRQFMFEFYGHVNIDSSRQQRLLNDSVKTICPILYKQKEWYSGFVYNLEVEEDNSYSTLNATVHNCFSNDSNGFFKRSLIESCVASIKNDIEHRSGSIVYRPIIIGNSEKRYVFGIDPASEVDNFSIVVIELHEDHRRIVYCWTTTRTDHRVKLKAGLVTDTDFYGYCARKIRELMNTFICDRIVMDSQGGGIAVSEALHDKDKLRDGEHQVWPIINPDKPQDTDVETGLHLIDMANFASAAWTEEANHGFRKDLEDKICLFPEFDPAMIELASIADTESNRIYDTLEDNILEIEDLKNELCTIVMEKTTTGRDRWVTPEVKIVGNRKGRLRKDRYSALIMANMGARQLMRNPVNIAQTTLHGGWSMPMKSQGGNDFTGPDWFTSKMNGIYD